MQFGSDEALYPVSRGLDSEKEAQNWEFQCKTSMELWHSSWQWFKVDNWKGIAFYQCPLNSVVTGVKTYLNNERKQPHFQFKCWSSPNYSTTGCKLSKQNEYPTQEKVLVGAFVSAEDSWRFLSCGYKSSYFWSIQTDLKLHAQKCLPAFTHNMLTVCNY